LIYGGYTKKGGEYFRDVYRYDIPKATWELFETRNTPSARIDHSFVRYKDYAYIFGGNDGVKRLDCMYELSLERKSWREVKRNGNWPTARFGHSAVVFED